MKILFLLTLFFAMNPAIAKSTGNMALCQVDLESSKQQRAMADKERQEFIAEFADLILADETQNLAWIEDALNTPPGTDIHFIIENAWMKKLNDKVFKNKDLVTALTNYHKTLFREELNRRAPKLKLHPYQDFKSTRPTLSGRVSGSATAVTEAFVQANARFYASKRLRAIIRAEDMKEIGFRLGAGYSESEAALAGRDARDNSGNSNFSLFWDPRVSARLEAKLSTFKNLHQLLIDQLSRTALLVSERGQLGLHLDIFASSRKAKKSDFLATLRQLFPNEKLDQGVADLILKYTQIADEFSPSVLVAKRELLSIHEAPFGAISIDFIGLGAENLRATAQALIQAEDLATAVRLTRTYEREVTAAFEKRKDLVRAAFADYFSGQVNVRFSGDDGVIIPGRAIEFREQLYLVQKLSLIMPRPYFRMAVIDAEGAAYVDSSQLITHGESVEKNMRQILGETLGSESLSDLSIDTFMPDTGKFRKVYLVLGAKKKLTWPQRKIIRAAFERAVETLENQVRAQGLAIEYQATEAYVIFGKKPY
jgi:hypothetical protein